jgi:hypothetical protein
MNNTMLSSPVNLLQMPTFLNCSTWKTRFSAPLVIFGGAPVRELHMAFRAPYIYGYITKLCRQQAEVIHKKKIPMFATWEKAKPEPENVRGLNLAAVKRTMVQVTRQPL